MRYPLVTLGAWLARIASPAPGPRGNGRGERVVRHLLITSWSDGKGKLYPPTATGVEVIRRGATFQPARNYWQAGAASRGERGAASGRAGPPGNRRIPSEPRPR